jgi:curved DNA-binding protein
MDYKDYYKILEINKTASESEIKSSYRKLANKYHPDKNKNDKAFEDKFKEINEAYQVLGDADKRRKYDNLGMNWNRHQSTGGTSDNFNWDEWFQQPKSGRGRQKSSGSKGSYTKGDYNTYREFFSRGGGVSDFFERIFGGAANETHGFSQEQGYYKQQESGQNLDTNLEITLEEAFRGSVRQIQTGDKKVEVQIKQGVADGQVITLQGMGSTGRNGGTSGDLNVKISIKQHTKLERKGDDLYVEVWLDLFTLILGGSAKIKTFSGTIKFNVPPASQNGKLLKLSNQGMPKYNKPNENGDLYIEVLAKLPDELTEDELNLVKALKELRKKK